MQIKVVSLNLWQGGNLFPAIIDFLKSEDADVLLLQEVYDGKDPGLTQQLRSLQVLRESLAYPYDIFAPAYTADRQEGKILAGNAILSKFPIQDHQTVFLTKPEKSSYVEIPENYPLFPRILQTVILDTAVGDVTVSNIHGVWDLDGDNDSPERQRMIDIVLEQLADKTRVILAGDTNAKATNASMQRLAEQFPSVFGIELASTFNMRQKTNPGYASAAVDHMYVSPDITVIGKDCPDVDISDHRPVTAILELR